MTLRSSQDGFSGNSYMYILQLFNHTAVCVYVCIGCRTDEVMLAGKSDGGGAGAWTLIGLLLVTSQCGAGAPTSLRSQHDDEAKPAAAAAESPLVRSTCRYSFHHSLGLPCTVASMPLNLESKSGPSPPPHFQSGVPPLLGSNPSPFTFFV